MSNFIHGILYATAVRIVSDTTATITSANGIKQFIGSDNTSPPHSLVIVLTRSTSTLG